MKQRNLHKEFSETPNVEKVYRAAEPSKFSLNLSFTPRDYALCSPDDKIVRYLS
jgi:hypothetical protein